LFWAVILLIAFNTFVFDGNLVNFI